LLAALFYAVPVLADPTYTVFRVPGAWTTYPYAINLFGTVTGYYEDLNGQHGFVRDPSGRITKFDPPGSTGTVPLAINIAGTIVGGFQTATGGHSFMRDSKGTITIFDPPHATNGSGAWGINAEGAIVGVPGYVRNPDGTFLEFDVNGSGASTSDINVAYLVTGYYSGTGGVTHGYVGWPYIHIFAIFDPPGSIITHPTSMNSDGAITGIYQDSSFKAHAFVRDPHGKIVSFDPVGSTWTEPWAINDSGAIVGYYCDSNGCHSFVRDPGGAITLFDVPGSNRTFAKSINERGVITGYFAPDLGDPERGFVRTP
jgi:uncharacterized membrane protein